VALWREIATEHAIAFDGQFYRRLRKPRGWSKRQVDETVQALIQSLLVTVGEGYVVQGDLSLARSEKIEYFTNEYFTKFGKLPTDESDELYDW